MTQPIVLAYSGGLDTSFLVPWVAEHYQRPVITVTVDTGGIDAAAARTLEERALALGAVAHHHQPVAIGGDIGDGAAHVHIGKGRQRGMVGRQAAGELADGEGEEVRGWVHGRCVGRNCP